MGEFIGYRRLRDWLRLLSFEVESVQLGAYRPPVRSDAWLQRFEWMDRVGARWWPVLGAVYFLVAVKRVRGMRVIGPAWKKSRKTKGGFYLAMAAEMEQLAEAYPDCGSRYVGLAARALNHMIVLADTHRLTRQQIIMFDLDPSRSERLQVRGSAPGLFRSILLDDEVGAL